MKELEVKILEINREEVQRTLISLGARKILDSEIRTLFFDFKDSRIQNMKDVLRLRKENGKTDLTYKKVSLGEFAKQAEEYSVEVSSIEAAQQVLEHLGLFKTEDMAKHRISYRLNSARFDIDRFLGTYDFIPEFLEIEAESLKIIHRNAELLGFRAKDCLPWSTEELIQHYNKKMKSWH